MKCYNCGATISDSDRCVVCGSNVKMLKKAAAISNICYNDGLQKAKVRDLTGAIISLKKSLSFNKENTQARNLLGLVYFEIGEVVDALSEWVISKYFQPDGNIADRYLNAIQKNPSRLDTINQTIKKYNQALMYCQQNSEDLAIIQLKKVLSLNPNLIKGYNLLALLHIKQNNNDKAFKVLKKALKINKTDTTTLRYMEEINKSDNIEDDIFKRTEIKRDKDKLSYKSGNETIIQPKEYKESTGLSTVINIIIGVVLGACVVWFLAVPGIKHSANANTNDALIEANETIAAKNTEISSLESEIEKSKNEIDSLNDTIENDAGTSLSYEALFKARDFCDKRDYESAADEFIKIKEELLADEAKGMYESLKEDVLDKALNLFFNSGYSEYNNGNYEAAAQLFERVIGFDERYRDGNALYYLGQSYRLNGDKDKAKEAYERAMELLPDSSVYENCKSYLSQLEE